MKHIKEFNNQEGVQNLSENLSLDIRSDSVINKINDLIKDLSMEWAYGQGTEPGEEREMVADSFVEGANTVISLLKGDDDLLSLYKDSGKNDEPDDFYKNIKPGNIPPPNF